MTAGALKRTSDSSLPKVHHFGRVTSTFDTAFELYEENRLEPWDSVLAKSQTDGRGQMRRHWDSPPGNLYASLRLPPAPPFSTIAAPVAIGALWANALRSFGCAVQLKWPNDLVIIRNGVCAKLGGILLEERKGCLLAGVGINIDRAPDPGKSQEGFTLPAADLNCEGRSGSLPSPSQLWRGLLRHLYSAWRSGNFFAKIWRDTAEELLLWRGEMVTMKDGRECVQGILGGIGENGAALLEINGKTEEILSGSMWPAADARRDDKFAGCPGKELPAGEKTGLQSPAED